MSQAASVLEHPVVTGLREASAAQESAAGSPVWQLSDTEVEAGIGALLEIEARVGALRAALLREATGRDLRARTRAATVQRWPGTGSGSPPHPAHGSRSNVRGADHRACCRCRGTAARRVSGCRCRR